MIEFEIELGLKELYTLKNFSFDINNTGSADLNIIDVTTSSNNIQMGYIKTPFVIDKRAVAQHIIIDVDTRA